MTDAKSTPNDRQIRSSLSPQEQAVLEASAEHWAGTRTQAIAAALRAAALVPNIDRLRLLALADELEGQG
jgi:hypothetical protein